MARWSAASILALAGMAAAAGEKVAWDKPDAAFGKAAATGKLICWYFLVNEVDKPGAESG
jgi:hypothetical protein